jgi:membrane-associated phospholipid phosphatase
MAKPAPQRSADPFEPVPPMVAAAGGRPVAMAVPRRAVPMSPLAAWIAALLLTSLAVVVSFLWLDRPIAYLAHDLVQPFDLFSRLPKIPGAMGAMIPIAGLAVFVLGLRALTGRALTRLQAVFVLCSLSLGAATVIKGQLKYVFGRTWPETWLRNNPSLIRDGVYGFHPFHGGRAYESFPSGHTAVTFAVVSVLWICYPRFRPLFAVIGLGVAVGLVGANFHFLSDVIAGAFVGVSTGWIGVALWQAGAASPLPPKGRPPFTLR